MLSIRIITRLLSVYGVLLLYFFSQPVLSADPGTYVISFKAGAEYRYQDSGGNEVVVPPGGVIDAQSFSFDPVTGTPQPVSIAVDWTGFNPFAIQASVVSVPAHQQAEGPGPSRLRGVTGNYVGRDASNNLEFIFVLLSNDSSNSTGEWRLSNGSFSLIASGTYILRNAETVTVPEPPAAALILFAGMVPLVILARRRYRS